MGLSVSVMKVKNHIAKSHLKVMIAVLQGQNFIVDDNGQPCTFNTTVHNPLQPKQKPLPIGQLTNLNNIPNKEHILANMSQGADTIIFQQENKFLRNFRQLLRRTKQDLYLGIQVVEKPEPKDIQLINKQAVINKQGNFGGMEYELVAWYYFKLTQEIARKITQGSFTFTLYEPPLRKMPLDFDKVKESGKQIEFIIQECEYDDETLEKVKIKKKLKEDKEEVVETREEIEKQELEEKRKSEPYIENLVSQIKDKTFEKGMGIDFYIDGGRFLPDNVTVVKIVMQVYNRKCREVFKSEAGLPELDSANYNPTFHFRRELRKEWFDPTSLVLISVDTIDKAKGEVRIVGYASINLFMNRFTREQPQDENDQDILLQTGCYQLPLYCEEPYRTAPFTNQKLLNLERLPCSSLLVRILMAPLSEDGLRTLNIIDFPDKSQWGSLGLWAPRPFYSTASYNTSFYSIRDTEKELFIHRLQRIHNSVREAAYLVLKSRNNSKQMEDPQLQQYLDTNLNKTKNSPILDMKYFAKYQAQSGFKFSLDGLHNVQSSSKLVVGIYCLNPPGAFYDDKDPDVKDVHLNSNFDWNSAIRSPQFLEGFATFQDIKFSRHLHILVDLKSISFEKVEPEINDIGWTALPVFSPDGYVMSNIYQVPVIQGSLTPTLRKAFQTNDVWTYINDDMNDKRKKPKDRLKYLDKMSIICRLLDTQREGHFKNAFDPNRIDFRYIPQDKLKYYAQNQSEVIKLQKEKKMETLIPLKGNSNSFNQKITNSFAQKFNMKQYEII